MEEESDGALMSGMEAEKTRGLAGPVMAPVGGGDVDVASGMAERVVRAADLLPVVSGSVSQIYAAAAVQNDKATRPDLPITPYSGLTARSPRLPSAPPAVKQGRRHYIAIKPSTPTAPNSSRIEGTRMSEHMTLT